MMTPVNLQQEAQASCSHEESEQAQLLVHFRKSVAADLRELAWLQNNEVTAEVLTELKSVQFPDNLGLRLQTPEGKEACQLVRKAIGDLPKEADEAVLDDLAADFTAIYLSNGYHISPYESVWLTDEGLVRQAPMIQVREWYKRHDLLAKDWQKQADDYIALEVEFVAHLLERDDEEETLIKVAQFLDEHPLRWIREFSMRVSTRCSTPFYAGLVLLTMHYLEELRTLLEAILQTPRPSEEEIEKRMRLLSKPVGVTCAPIAELVEDKAIEFVQKT